MKENHFHQELLEQVIGMIENEIGGYLWALQAKSKAPLWSNDSLQFYIQRAGAGFDVFILDPAYVEFDVKDIESYRFRGKIECDFESIWYFENEEYSFYYTNTEEWCMIGHYHGNDLLHIIVNWEKEKQGMKNHVTRIFNNYINRWKNEKIRQHE